MMQQGVVNGKASLNNNNKMPPQNNSCFPDQWNSTGGQGGGQGQIDSNNPQLSVVTTVWGMTGSSQAGPQQAQYTSSPSASGGMPPGYSNMKNQQQHQQSYWNNMNQNQGMASSYAHSLPQQRVESSGQGSSGESPNYNSSGNPIGVTAMVTAIATATATATASVVAFQERQDGNQQQQYNPHQQMNNQYLVQQQYGNTPGSQHPPRTKMTMQTEGYNNGRAGCRTSPYPNPQSHMSQKRGMPMTNAPPYPGLPPNVSPYDNGPQYSHGGYGSQQSCPNPRMAAYRSGMRSTGPGSRVPNSPAPPYAYPPSMQPGQPGYYGGQGGPPPNMRPMTQVPTHHSGPPPSYAPNPYLPPQHQQPHPAMNQYGNSSSGSSSGFAGSTSPSAYSSPSYGGSADGRGRSYQHSPIPGNPTPPLTPASAAPLPCYGMSHVGETKPVISSSKMDTELRLTFPVRDGTILAPFRLEHNLAVSNHVFHLKPTVHQTLTYRSDLELQLKCFHHEDRLMNTNWPVSVQVSVNALPLCIDRGENKVSHKPLYLKDICQPGRNTLQITVSACCCSHLFVLQLVHRPSVRSVLQGLLRKRLLPAEHCITKIKRHFNSSSATWGSPADGDGVEQTAIKVSLKCPITYKKMALPARGHDCKHVQCFDLESYLHMNCERAAWRCPVCNKPAQLEGLEVDQYIWSILNTLNTSDADEVTIDSAANWRETTSNSGGGSTGFKIKCEDGEPCSAKKSKVTRPSDMQMSNWNSDMVMSPFGSPSICNISMGGGGPINGYGSSGGGMVWPGSPPQAGPYEFGNEYGGPLSRLKDSVNSLEALNAMEKSISEQASGGNHGKYSMEMNNKMSDMPYILHTPQTPHTPGTGDLPLVASSPSSVPNPNAACSSHLPDSDPPDLSGLTSSDLPSDLNFDPESVINGEGSGQEELNLLPHTGVDPLELLSYLEPSGLATPPSSGENGGSCSNITPDSISDDLLSLFD